MTKSEAEYFYEVFENNNLLLALRLSRQVVEAAREVVNDSAYIDARSAPMGPLRDAVEMYDKMLRPN